MAISPSMAERIVIPLARIYASAETTCIEKMAEYLDEGMDEADWAAKKLAQIRELRNEIDTEVIGMLEREIPPEVEQRLAEVYAQGQASAVADLRKVLPEDEIMVKTGLTGTDRRKIETLVQATIGKLENSHLRILRATNDAYRRVISHATEQVALGVMTRREGAQQALNQFANRGITGFVDSAGKSWSLQSYTEMAMRTSSAQTAIEGTTTRLEENNQDRAVFSEHGEECELCRPWEGKVVSLSGDDPNYPSLDEAIADGMFHPNCRHTLGAYIHGLSETPDPDPDPEGYEERQEQRYIERNIRKWKRREAAAMSDEEKDYARKYRASWQDRMRDFIDDTDRRRQSEREQIEAAI